jgi:hypothetical protein
MVAPQTVLEQVEIGDTQITNEERRAPYQMIAELSDYIGSVARTPDTALLPLL